MASVDVEMVTCACRDCACVIPASKAAAEAVSKDGKACCCDSCAQGHADHDGGDHAGCTCRG